MMREHSHPNKARTLHGPQKQVEGDYDLFFTAGAWGRSYVYEGHSSNLAELELLIGAGSYVNSITAYKEEGSETKLYLTSVNPDGGRGTITKASTDASKVDLVLALESSTPSGMWCTSVHIRSVPSG